MGDSDQGGPSAGAGGPSAGAGGPGAQPPSLAPGVALLTLAAALIVVVLVNPAMPDWLRATIAIVAGCVVVALLGYAGWVFRAAGRSRSGR